MKITKVISVITIIFFVYLLSKNFSYVSSSPCLTSHYDLIALTKGNKKTFQETMRTLQQNMIDTQIVEFLEDILKNNKQIGNKKMIEKEIKKIHTEIIDKNLSSNKGMDMYEEEEEETTSNYDEKEPLLSPENGSISEQSIEDLTPEERLNKLLELIQLINIEGPVYNNTLSNILKILNYNTEDILNNELLDEILKIKNPKILKTIINNIHNKLIKAYIKEKKNTHAWHKRRWEDFSQVSRSFTTLYFFVFFPFILFVWLTDMRLYTFVLILITSLYAANYDSYSHGAASEKILITPKKTKLKNLLLNLYNKILEKDLTDIMLDIIKYDFAKEIFPISLFFSDVKQYGENLNLIVSGTSLYKLATSLDKIPKESEHKYKKRHEIILIKKMQAIKAATTEEEKEKHRKILMDYLTIYLEEQKEPTTKLIDKFKLFNVSQKIKQYIEQSIENRDEAKRIIINSTSLYYESIYNWLGITLFQHVYKTYAGIINPIIYSTIQKILDKKKPILRKENARFYDVVIIHPKEEPPFTKLLESKAFSQKS